MTCRITLLVLALSPVAAQAADCGVLQRCIDAQMREMCLIYGGLPRNATEQDKVIAALRDRMTVAGCPPADTDLRCDEGAPLELPPPPPENCAELVGPKAG